MSALRALVSVALVCAVLAPVAQGCGFMTHQLVSHRAAAYFLNMENSTHAGIIKTYLNSVLAGSPFPDYMYTCGSNHDAGEAAHWPRFHAAAAKYIRTLPQPWTESTSKLVAFMYGAISHYIADVNWHGLGTPDGYGFIQTLGIADFNCTGDLCSSAHDAADTGGEFVASYASDLSWNHPMEWYVPIADLVQIYAIDNYTVQYTDVMECQVIFLVGDIVVKYLSAIIFEKETGRSAQLPESYFNFHVGGIDDMAVWAVRMWNRWSEWVVNGPPSPLPGPGANSTLEAFLREPHLFDFAADLKQKGYSAKALHQLRHYHSRSSHHSTIDFLYALSSDLLQEYTDSAKELGKSSPLASLLVFETDPKTRAMNVKLNKDEFNRVLTKKLPELLHKYEALLRSPSARRSAESILHGAAARDHARKTARAAMQISSSAPAPVASALPAVESEGVEALGAVEVGAPPSSFSSCLPIEYFGSSLASGDWDHDGIDDIAIGAYGFNGISNCSYPADETPYPQTGAVYVSYSSAPGSQQQIAGPSSYSRFGWSTATLDFNGDGIQDLAVGAPTDGWNWTTYAGDVDYRYWGSVLVFYGAKGGLSAEPSYTISTQTGTTLFGVTLSTGDVDGDGLADLLIGSPYSRGGNPNQVEAGAVHIFLSGGARVTGGSSLDTQADAILNSPDNFAFFGHSILYVNDTVQGPLLIVGAPTYRMASQATVGRIYGFPVGSLGAMEALQAAQHNVAAVAAFSVTGTVQHGKFGLSLAFGRFNGQSLELAVGSPSSNSSKAQNAGMVYVFSVSNLKGDVALSAVSVSTQLEAGSYGSRLGWRLVAFDMDKDGNDELIVTSPLLTGFLAPHHHGGLTLFKGGASFPTGVVTNADTSGYWATSGSVKFARLGDSVTVGDFDGDGMYEILAGAPNGVSPVNGAEYSGSVFMYSPPKL